MDIKVRIAVRGDCVVSEQSRCVIRRINHEKKVDEKA